MGLFDGAADGTGATADIAALFGLPVVLVVDVTGMGASVAALIDGFRRHREDVEVVGVILNRVASPAHAELLSRACFEHVSTPVLGTIPRDATLALPSRHLGLVQASEHPDLGHLPRPRRPGSPNPGSTSTASCASPARPASRCSGLTRGRCRRSASGSPSPATRPSPSPTPRCWTAGAGRGRRCCRSRRWPTSRRDPSADAVYLPGGYPELHAGRLAGNARFQAGLRAAAERGAFVYGECGGYMALGQALIDRAGVAYPMAGLLPVVTSFAEPRLHLGYRQLELLSTCPLGRVGAGFRGHEFHYAREIERPARRCSRPAAPAALDLGGAGLPSGQVAGSFLHLIDRTPSRPPLPRSA